MLGLGAFLLGLLVAGCATPVRFTQTYEPGALSAGNAYIYGKFINVHEQVDFSILGGSKVGLQIQSESTGEILTIPFTKIERQNNQSPDVINPIVIEVVPGRYRLKAWVWVSNTNTEHEEPKNLPEIVPGFNNYIQIDANTGLYIGNWEGFTRNSTASRSARIADLRDNFIPTTVELGQRYQLPEGFQAKSLFEEIKN